MSAEFWVEAQAFFMRHYMMCGAWIVVVGMLIYVQFKLMSANIKKCNSSVAIMMVNHDEGAFIDLRSTELFQKGHITNSINISLSEIKDGKLNRIERFKERTLILVGKDKFDSDCFNAGKALKKEGYKVLILEGGIMEWINANLPVAFK